MEQNPFDVLKQPEPNPDSLRQAIVKINSASALCSYAGGISFIGEQPEPARPIDVAEQPEA